MPTTYRITHVGGIHYFTGTHAAAMAAVERMHSKAANRDGVTTQWVGDASGGRFYVVAPNGATITRTDLEAVRVHTRCGRCMVGNHTGTNGTVGCEGGLCACTCTLEDALA